LDAVGATAGRPYTGTPNFGYDSDWICPITNPEGLAVYPKYLSFLFLFCFSTLALAGIPSVNVYQVEKRNYSLEPQADRFTISAYDKALLLKPSFDTYTQMNPLQPDEIYTLKPYPYTSLLPSMGKWMVITDINAQPVYVIHDPSTPAVGTKKPSSWKTIVPAHWISLTNARGQYIIEPINYIFIVYAKNADESFKLFHQAITSTGFIGSASQNHSGGYHAFIGNLFLGQLSNDQGQPLTYSNGDFKYQNDHFRVFGPYPLKIRQQQAFIFTASLSEESGIDSNHARLSPEKLEAKLNKMNKENPFGFYTNYGHHFVSFSNARNNLAVAFIQSGYSTYYSTLGNVLNTLGESTEDHDGNVFITEIKRLN